MHAVGGVVHGSKIDVETLLRGGASAACHTLITRGSMHFTRACHPLRPGAARIPATVILRPRCRCCGYGFKFFIGLHPQLNRGPGLVRRPSQRSLVVLSALVVG